MSNKRKMTRMLKGLRNQITSYFLVIQAQDLEEVRMSGSVVSGRTGIKTVFRYVNAILRKNSSMLGNAQSQN